MASMLQIASPDAIRRIQRVQTVTIAWMSVEAVVSLFAAWRASDCSMNSSQRSEIVHLADLPRRSDVCIQL